MANHETENSSTKWASLGRRLLKEDRSNFRNVIVFLYLMVCQTTGKIQNLKTVHVIEHDQKPMDLSFRFKNQ